MSLICYAGCGLALLCALLVIASRNAMHALLYLILMLLALGLVFFILGAPFVAVLQVVIYAGAIMVLFVFVVMMLNLAEPGQHREQLWLMTTVGVTPLALAAALLALSLYAFSGLWSQGVQVQVVGPKQVGITLYREYALAIEMVSLLLLAGLIGAYHLAPLPRSEIEPVQESDHD
jgi:NADH-quinone oxidoreductase subunit J